MILDDIATALTSAGVVGGVTGWTLAKSFLPPTPDKIIAIFEAGSSSDPETTTDHEYPSIQIRVRGISFGYSEASSKLDAIMNVLHNQAISGLIYIFASGSKLPLGYDGNNRPEIVQNYRTMRLRT